MCDPAFYELPEVHCPHCGSADTWPTQPRDALAEKGRRRYTCFFCSRVFWWIEGTDRARAVKSLAGVDETGCEVSV